MCWWQLIALAEVTTQLVDIGINFTGIDILDVGFGLGFNAAAWTSLGATVFGIEPDKDAYNWALQQNNISATRAICSKLQDMPREVGDQVDVATVLLWNIYRSEYDVVLGALSKRIAPEGMVVIGIHDETYISDPYGVAVKPHAERYFGNVQTKTFPGKWNRCLLVCSKPRLRWSDE